MLRMERVMWINECRMLSLKVFRELGGRRMLDRGKSECWFHDYK